uniref:BZIP domain-containing protein n=1 Tax=Chenopodium quinoa TaxID=63459 RepID=A0A803M1X0_CHEQI
MYQIDDDDDRRFHLPPPLSNQPNNNETDSSQFGIISSNHNKFLPNLHSYLPLHDLTTLNPTLNIDLPSSSSPNNSIINTLCSDDQTTKEQSEEQDIRRLKRMISNRESARRSRLRKRKQLENKSHY